MDAPAIISALGGPPVLAPLLGVSRTAVCNWRHSGIPSRHWPKIARAAAKAKPTKGITIDVLERASQAEATH